MSRLIALGSFLFSLLCAMAAYAQQEAQALLLVARPQIGDPTFAESVVMVTRHGRSRPMGVILNKPSPIRFGGFDGSADEKTEELVIYNGGPVSSRVIVCLFRSSESFAERRDLLSLGNGIYMGMGEAILKEMTSRKPRPELKVFTGLSRWDHGQLENEVARGDWLALPFDPDVALSGSVTSMWQELIAQGNQLRI